MTLPPLYRGRCRTTPLRLGTALALGACLGSAPACARGDAAWAPSVLAPPHAASAGDDSFVPCPQPEAQPLRVSAQAPSDRALVCEGGAAAVAFLSGVGVAARSAVLIEVKTRLPEEAPPSAAGCFIPSRDRVYLLSYAEFRKRGHWFRVPVSRDLYRSLAAHEAAHAIVACHFARAAPPVRATEYIAYVTMFSTMVPPLRERVLRAMPGRGFGSEDEITEMRRLFDPMGFGVASYRHFKALPEGRGAVFLRQVLDGQAIAD